MISSEKCFTESLGGSVQRIVRSKNGKSSVCYRRGSCVTKDFSLQKSIEDGVRRWTLRNEGIRG